MSFPVDYDVPFPMLEASGHTERPFGPTEMQGQTLSPGDLHWAPPIHLGDLTSGASISSGKTDHEAPFWRAGPTSRKVASKLLSGRCGRWAGTEGRGHWSQCLPQALALWFQRLPGSWLPGLCDSAGQHLQQRSHRLGTLSPLLHTYVFGFLE